MIKYTSNFQGYSCKFSPFVNNILACSFSQYYGMIGNGKINIFSFNNTDKPSLKLENTFNTNEGCFDICFSEANQNHLISTGGDGCVKLWDITSQNNNHPLFNLNIHKGECWCCIWNCIQIQNICTCGSDQTVNEIDVTKGEIIYKHKLHSNVVYSCAYHPSLSNIIASSSADGSCKVIDTKSNKCVKNFFENYEVMFCDFGKYDNIIALALNNGVINIYDLRSTTNTPLYSRKVHNLTCRKLQFSPLDSNILISIGYDMNVCIWPFKLMNSNIKVFKHHTEFVYGMDCSLFSNGLIATTSWDNNICVYNYNNNIVP